MQLPQNTNKCFYSDGQQVSLTLINQSLLSTKMSLLYGSFCKASLLWIIFSNNGWTHEKTAKSRRQRAEHVLQVMHNMFAEGTWSWGSSTGQHAANHAVIKNEHLSLLSKVLYYEAEHSLNTSFVLSPCSQTGGRGCSCRPKHNQVLFWILWSDPLLLNFLLQGFLIHFPFTALSLIYISHFNKGHTSELVLLFHNAQIGKFKVRKVLHSDFYYIKRQDSTLDPAFPIRPMQLYSFNPDDIISRANIWR